MTAGRLEGEVWSPASWQRLPSAQQPTWPDVRALEEALSRISRQPPLVFAGEARELTANLARVAAGQAFLLQAGDCAESFETFSANDIRDKLKVILQMAAVLTYGGGVPVVKVGRMAGQFAKPRSSAIERRDERALPAFRGEIVNGPEFDEVARMPDPGRLLAAYHQSAATLNLLRAFTQGGFADLAQVHAWNLEFVATSPEGRRYEQLADGIDRALRFMAACGIDVAESRLRRTDFYTSHEGLLLGYEEALTRQDSLTGDWYDCSAHLLWIGERTRDPNGAHVEFVSGIHNPVAVKLGPGATPDEVVELCRRIDPGRVPGRLTLIARAGAERVEEVLPEWARAVREAGHPVVWACDPMHGNTFLSESGYKTRHLDSIVKEVRGFFAACRLVGVWPGGLHVELTGESVTECLGGSEPVSADQLETRYETICDPRLNARQALDLAFAAAELLQAG
ncbi:MAG: class II 3-deoxy-7-phosphoheptulonate synthase [Acidimicrobiia bacterium]